MISVICYFWVDKARARSYAVTPEHVRTWDAMMARNITIPHRRICVTHRPDLIDFMETVPLDTTKHVPGTCAVKLMHWREDIAPILGKRIAAFDIDCVVTGSLDEILSREEDVLLWKNPNYAEGGRRGFYQGSFQMLTAGARPFLYDDFDPNETPSWLNRRFGGFEQCWISERLNTSYPEPGWDWSEAYLNEDDGMYGAGRLFNGQTDRGVTSELPENARIVFTPGNREPSQPEVQLDHPWMKDFYHCNTSQPAKEAAPTSM